MIFMGEMGVDEEIHELSRRYYHAFHLCQDVIYRQASFLAATKPRNEIEEQWREHELFINAASFMHRQPL